MFRKFILLTIVTCATVFPAVAQDAPGPRSLERKMNALVIDAMMRLEESSAIADRQSGREFMMNFQSEQTPVFCDMFSSEDFLEQIPVRQYVDNFFGTDDVQKFTTLSLTFRNVRKTGWTFEDGIWYCTLSLEKSVNYFDNNFVYFPLTGQNPGGNDFNISIRFAFNESCNECKIAGITCENAGDFKKLASHYIVVQKNDAPNDARRDEEILVDNNRIEFNEFGQGYGVGSTISHWDDEIKVSSVVKAQNARYDYIQFRYKSRHFRLRLRNEYAPFSAYSFSGRTEILASESSSAYSVGIDIGYSVPVSRIFKIGFYTGIGVSFSKISMTTNPYQYSYMTSVNGDNTPHTRNYQIDYASQGASFTDLSVPVYISPEFRLNKSVSLFLDIGAKVYFNTVARTDPFHVKGRVSGMYQDGTPVPDGVYGTGEIDSDFMHMINAVTFMRNPVDITLTGNIGMNINLYDSMVYLEVKAGYEHGLTWSYQSSESPFFLEDHSGSEFPLVYDYRYGEIASRPLADCISFKRRAIWLNLGLMLKL